MIWDLPTSLEVNGKQWEIRSDYRDILNVIVAFEDPDLKPEEKQYVALFIIYKDFANMPPDDLKQAYEAALWFIDGGKKEAKSSGPRTMDWEQDAAILFPAINSVAGREVRAMPYLHWWTFIGYFMEIQKGVFATVLQLRSKKAKKKKFEKDEQDFWRSNKEICELKPKLSTEEKEEKEKLLSILGGSDTR